MNCRQKNQIEKVQATQYASREYFCRLFTEKMDSLYWLAFLLTADHEKAEHCFVAGLEDSVDKNLVFQSWAHTWAKRTIIQNAIHVVKPRPGATSAHGFVHSGLSQSVEDLEFRPVLELENFERFVFVITVLERYSDQDCSLLLDRLIHEVREGRSRALQQIGDSPSAEMPTSLVCPRREDNSKTAAPSR